MEIKEYEEKYAKGMSEIILSNLYTITIKDHGKEVVDRIARHFTEEEIKKNFPDRVKCFVAVDEDKVLGTASIDNIKSMYGVEVENSANKYIILTVFTHLEYQHQGIGEELIQKMMNMLQILVQKKSLYRLLFMDLSFIRNLDMIFIKEIIHKTKMVSTSYQKTLIKYQKRVYKELFKMIVLFC